MFIITTVFKGFYMKKLILVSLLFIAVIAPGCAQKQQVAPEPRCLSGVDKENAMSAAEKTLVRMNFVIDKLDPNLDVMTTKPLAGAQFWDSAGGYNSALASIHSIQRTVELGFTSGQGQICITPKVKIERLSIPERQIDSAGRGYILFTDSKDTMQSLSLSEEQEQKMDWIDFGRDYQLEKIILDRIEKQIQKDAKKGRKR